MGSETLPKRGFFQTIQDEWTNAINRALKEGVVPRNSSGVAADSAGSLGAASYRFENLFSKTAKLTDADGNSATIKPHPSLATNFPIKMFEALGAQAKRATISSAGQLAFVERDYLITSEIANIASDDVALAETAYIEINTDGTEKYLFMLVPTGDSTLGHYGQLKVTPTSGASSAGINLLRTSGDPIVDGSALLSFTPIAATQFAAAPFVIWYDQPAAGDYGYYLAFEGSKTWVNYSKLVCFIF